VGRRVRPVKLRTVLVFDPSSLTDESLWTTLIGHTADIHRQRYEAPRTSRRAAVAKAEAARVSRNMARETEPMDEASKPTNNTRTATCGVETGSRGPILLDPRQILWKDCTVQDNGAIGPVVPLSEVTGVKSEPKSLHQGLSWEQEKAIRKPLWGTAGETPIRRIAGGVVVVVRARESLVHGEGPQGPCPMKQLEDDMPASVRWMIPESDRGTTYVVGNYTRTWRAVCVERRTHGSGEGELGNRQVQAYTTPLPYLTRPWVSGWRPTAGGINCSWCTATSAAR
jgi:hypothetical protein